MKNEWYGHLFKCGGKKYKDQHEGFRFNPNTKKSKSETGEGILELIKIYDQPVRVYANEKEKCLYVLIECEGD